MSRLLQKGSHPVSKNTRKCCPKRGLYQGAQSKLRIGNHCTNPITYFCALRFVFSIVLMCDASYVVRRTSRQTYDISYLTYVRSYDKVARSTIFSHQNKFGSIDRTLGGRQPYPARASLGTVDIIFKPRVSAFQNCPQRYMGHNIARDIALATKLVILWTGISVYTSIPVKVQGDIEKFNKIASDL